MINKEIGKKIKDLREKKKWTKQELAKKLGYESDTAIHLIEVGKRKLSIEKLKIIAGLFEVSVSDLISEVENKKFDVITALRSDEALDEKDINQISSFIDFIKEKGKNSDR